MTLEENNKLKRNDKINSSSNLNINIDSSNSNDINSESFNDKLFKEAKYILNALEGGSLNLTPDGEVKLKQDLDLILSNSKKQNQEPIHLKEISNDNQISVDESNNPESVDSGVVGENIGSIEEEVASVEEPVEEVVEQEGSVDLGVVEENMESQNSSNELEENLNLSKDVKAISVDDALTDLIDDYSNDVVIKVNNVSMDYKVSQDKIDTLKEFFIRTIKRNKEKTKTITALKNISFEIPKGDRVGIIGFNGAGKSTLLKLLSRVYDPTEGTIETKGKIAPLLELGAGFDNNYTGKANIFLNGAFLGYSEDFIKEKYDEIVEFSELGEAINYHVKTYSSGMRAKLGFSIATIVEPDILIIDEILSVGDIKFRRKSADKIRSLINSGITVLLVSHSVGQIRELCNKAIWIDNGEIKMMGEVNKVCDAYVKAADDASKEQLKNIELN